MVGPVGQVRGLLHKSPTNQLVVIHRGQVNSQTVIFLKSPKRLHCKPKHYAID